MAARKRDALDNTLKPAATPSFDLASLMVEFDELVDSFQTGLLRSLQDTTPHQLKPPCHEYIRREACRLAISDLSARYARKSLRRSLHRVEAKGRRVEERLQSLSLADSPTSTDDLATLHNGHFRLFSTHLFDLLGQPTDLRFGTLRFHKSPSPSHHPSPTQPPESPWLTVELALNNSFFVADSMETLPYHNFRLPSAPSLQNRGILSRKPQDNGAFPEFDSWLLFTFLGNGCIKVEVPIEMCADVYGGRLRGCENEEVLFWGIFIDDDDME